MTRTRQELIEALKAFCDLLKVKDPLLGHTIQARKIEPPIPNPPPGSNIQARRSWKITTDQGRVIYTMEDPRKHLKRQKKGSKYYTFKQRSRAAFFARDIDTMLGQAEDCKSFKEWYQKSLKTIRAFFGDDTERFAKILAILSPQRDVARNVEMGLDAYACFLSGDPFPSGFGEDAIEKLEKLRENSLYQPTGEKVDPFARALLGDLSQSPLDTHMMQLLFDVPAEYSAKHAHHREGHKIINSIAEKLQWHPAEVQAALWAVHIIETKKPVTDFEQELKKRIARVEELTAQYKKQQEGRAIA